MTCVSIPASKPRLLILAILESRDGVVVSFGLVCSSFVSISRGSTRRHYFLPEGDLSSRSVLMGTTLAARTCVPIYSNDLSPLMPTCGHSSCYQTWVPTRTCLAMYLIMAKKGVWVLEHPSSSLVFRLPSLQQLLRRVQATYVRSTFHAHGMQYRAHVFA